MVFQSEVPNFCVGKCLAEKKSNYFVQVNTLSQWLLCASNYCTKLKMMKKRNLVTYTLMQILASEENVKQRYP